MSEVLLQFIVLVVVIVALPRYRALLRRRDQSERKGMAEYIRYWQEARADMGPLDSDRIPVRIPMQDRGWDGTKEGHGLGQGVLGATHDERGTAYDGSVGRPSRHRDAGRHLSPAVAARWSLGGAITGLRRLARRLHQPVRGQHRHRRADRSLRPSGTGLTYSPRHLSPVGPLTG